MMPKDDVERVNKKPQDHRQHHAIQSQNTCRKKRMKEARLFVLLVLLQVAFLFRIFKTGADKTNLLIIGPSKASSSTAPAETNARSGTDNVAPPAVEKFPPKILHMGEKGGSTSNNHISDQQKGSTLDIIGTASMVAGVEAAANPAVDPPAKKPSLIIAGLTRNSEKDLNGIKRSIQRVFQHFDVSKIIFFENDSVDATAELIEGWNKARWMPGRRKVVVLTEHNLRNATLKNRRLRTSILAHGRNRLWKEILVQDKRNPVDYVLQMDMDEVNQDLNNVEQCLNLPSNWTGCCSNTYTIYYDLWGLRSVDPNWLPNDIMKINPKYHISKYRHIPASHAAIPVNSCFGGAALYDLRQIRHLNLTTYNGIDEKDFSQPVCEHVGWYDNIRKQLQQRKEPHNNMQLYIQPKMMNRGPSRLRARKPIMDIFGPQWEATWNRTELSAYYRLVLPS
jgi:hypothetical protein